MKINSRISFLQFLLVLIIVPISCQKIDWLKNTDNKKVKTINVRSVVELYAVVNDPLNVDSRIVLERGTYVLDASQPNAGRIELLENMELVGQEGSPERVIIDASALPGTSFTPPQNFPAPRTGAIRMGRGYNKIEWITVKGNSSAQALSVIDTDLMWSASSSKIKIAHCIVSGGRIGIDIRNVGAASIGRLLEAEIVDNNVTENLVQFGQGIEIQNANGASRAIIRANMRNNYVHGNKVGLRSFTNNANNTNIDSAYISIQSENDRFEDNGLAISVMAALNQGTNSTSNGNFLQFNARGTSVQNNLGVLPPDITDPAPGGFYAAGGFSANGAEASNNILQVGLWDCIIRNNQGPGIKAYGFFSATSSASGKNNNVKIELNGVSKQATHILISSVPSEPAATNTIQLIRN